MKKSLFYAFLTDIRFWIMLFFVVRLTGITQPPLEIAHNWRQTTVTMVARNFFETDANIFYPRIDIAGEKSGITGMEFPLLNYLIYLVSLLFGYDHWYGRLINLLVSSAGVYAFYRLVKHMKSERLAVFASLILLCSLWFTYSRKIMPDTFAVSLVLIGLHAGYSFLHKPGRYWLLAVSFTALSAGILAKLPAAVLLAVIPFLVFGSRWEMKKRVMFAFSVAFALLPAAWWYFYWVPYLNTHYGLTHFFMGKDLVTGAAELLERWPLTASMFYETSIKFIAFGAFISGLILMILKREKFFLLFFVFSLVAFVVIMMKAGETFTRHSYYMIPFIPVMAVVAAYAIALIPNRKIAWVVIGLIMLEGVLNQQHDFRIKPPEMALLKLETVLDQLGTQNDLVVINSGEYPTPMYFAHRKGWVEGNSRIADSSYIADLKSKGLKYIIVLKQVFGTSMPLDYMKMYDADEFTVYKP